MFRPRINPSIKVVLIRTHFIREWKILNGKIIIKINDSRIYVSNFFLNPEIKIIYSKIRKMIATTNKYVSKMRDIFFEITSIVRSKFIILLGIA